MGEDGDRAELNRGVRKIGGFVSGAAYIHSFILYF